MLPKKEQKQRRKYIMIYFCMEFGVVNKNNKWLALGVVNIVQDAHEQPRWPRCVLCLWVEICTCLFIKEKGVWKLNGHNFQLSKHSIIKQKKAITKQGQGGKIKALEKKLSTIKSGINGILHILFLLAQLIFWDILLKGTIPCLAHCAGVSSTFGEFTLSNMRQQFCKEVLIEFLRRGMKQWYNELQSTWPIVYLLTVMDGIFKIVK